MSRGHKRELKKNMNRSDSKRQRAPMTSIISNARVSRRTKNNFITSRVSVKTEGTKRNLKHTLELPDQNSLKSL